MHAQDNIVPLNHRNAVSSAAVESVIAETATLTHKYLPPLIKALFDKADTTLFEMADKSSNNTQQAHYFDTMRELRLLRSEIESRFSREMSKQFENRGKQQTRDDQVESREFDMESLSLVDDDNLEESLALKGMVEKLNTHHAKQLEALEKRFSYLLSDYRQETSEYPVSPEAICNAFSNALDVMEAEVPIKLIIYKLFDLYVISNLGPFYEAVNDLMIQAGILPQLPKPWRKPSRTEAPSAPAQHSTSEVMTTTDGTDSDLEMSLFSALQSLIGGPAGSGVVPIHPGTQIPPGSGINAVQPQQLLAGLTGLQQSLPDDHSSAIDSATLKNMLATSLQSDGTHDIVGFQQRESILIDVVAMLFDYILEDEAIPDIAKAQIARLQIPMVKAALIDAAFLAKKSHPARQLLNRLAQASSALDSNLQHEAPLLEEINRIVSVISTEFESEITLFERELQALESFLEVQEREAQQVNEIITGAKSRQESEERIKSRANEVIRLKLAMSEVPEPLQNIIRNSWLKVLIHTGQNDGVDSTAWHERCELISRLIESVQPLDGAEERRKLLKTIPGIVSTIRLGMTEAGFNNDTISQTLKVVEPLHMAIIAPSTPDSESTDDAIRQRAIENALNDMQEEMTHLDEMLAQLDGSLLDPAPIGEDIYQAIPEELIEDVVLSTEESLSPEDLPDDEYITTIRQMEVGQVVILHDRDDTPVRCKLSWKSELLDEYIFINWRHKVVAERTLNGLAGDLYQGRLQLLDQTPILERALEKVIGGLRKQQDGGSAMLPEGAPA